MQYSAPVVVIASLMRVRVFAARSAMPLFALELVTLFSLGGIAAEAHERDARAREGGRQETRYRRAALAIIRSNAGMPSIATWGNLTADLPLLS
jgi:hypothetical protein